MRRALVAVVVLGAAAVAHAFSDRGGDVPVREGAAVGPRVAAEALASVPPARLTLSDEIYHYRARLARRNGESFSHARLHAAHLLRFRAYGDPGDLDAAQEHLARREAQEGMTPAVLSAWAALHLARHEFADARAAAEEALRFTKGRDRDVLMRLFDARWATGRTDEAAAILELPLDTASPAYLSRRARVLDRAGEVELARDLFRSVAARTIAYAEPAAVQAWALVELGRFEHHAGDPHEAVRRYLEALEVLPGSPAATEALADVAYGVDRNVATAATLYRAALERGGHLDILPTLAAIETERGRIAQARSLTDEFIRLATADARRERTYRRPLAFVLADEPGTACRALELARADLAERRDSGAWSALAWATYRSGDVEAAYRAVLEAVGTGVPEPPVAWRAGVIAQAHGEVDEAREHLRTALDGASELSPAEVREARRLLDGGAIGSPPPVSLCPRG